MLSVGMMLRPSPCALGTPARAFIPSETARQVIYLEARGSLFKQHQKCTGCFGACWLTSWLNQTGLVCSSASVYDVTWNDLQPLKPETPQDDCARHGAAAYQQRSY